MIRNRAKSTLAQVADIYGNQMNKSQGLEYWPIIRHYTGKNLFNTVVYHNETSVVI